MVWFSYLRLLFKLCFLDLLACQGVFYTRWTLAKVAEAISLRCLIRLKPLHSHTGGFAKRNPGVYHLNTRILPDSLVLNCCIFSNLLLPQCCFCDGKHNSGGWRFAVLSCFTLLVLWFIAFVLNLVASFHANSESWDDFWEVIFPLSYFSCLTKTAPNTCCVPKKKRLWMRDSKT